MKPLFLVCIALVVSFPTVAAFARGGVGASHMSETGGAFGTSAAAPGLIRSGRRWQHRAPAAA
ncbi:hypothetical protein ACVWXO_004331 [Bradyrhizobium sp. LM2.7]